MPGGVRFQGIGLKKDPRPGDRLIKGFPVIPDRR